MAARDVAAVIVEPVQGEGGICFQQTKRTITMITRIPVPEKKEEAEFLKRLNRFEALVRCQNQTVLCHVANTGRMNELLVPKRRVIIRKARKIGRKTEWDLLIAHTGEGVPVFLESVMANRLILKALKEDSRGLKGTMS